MVFLTSTGGYSSHFFLEIFLLHNHTPFQEETRSASLRVISALLISPKLFCAGFMSKADTAQSPALLQS